MKKKILIVDDESSTRFLLELMLKKHYKVESAFSSVSMMEVLSHDQFDLILMDINLGKADSGINALIKLRTLEEYKNTPVMAVTAHALASDKRSLLNLGFNEYIAKPFEKEELLSLIEKLLSVEAIKQHKVI
jgi:CheY-like chemotaxis protein